MSKPPTFCLPYCSSPSSNAPPHNSTAATCAAIALSLAPFLPLPTRATLLTPPPSPPQQTHLQTTLPIHQTPHPLSPLSITLLQAPSPPPPSPPSSPAPSPPLIDKHYSQPSPVWYLEPAAPQKARLVLPPRPETAAELRILIRLLVALVVGGSIGMERRAANSLAGVRTFSLVSLGAAIFMTTTLVAFPDADPTRVAAAISSSVGFLGAGAMSKNSKQSRGLTTASSVWLAAALGIAAACGMFLLSFTGAVSTVLIARYARFDSSLHLIRGDPVGRLEDDEEGAFGATRFEDRVGYYGERRRGFEERGRDVYWYENGIARESGQLQALVDFDPSSNGEGREGGFEEDGGVEKERGNNGDNGT